MVFFKRMANFMCIKYLASLEIYIILEASCISFSRMMRKFLMLAFITFMLVSCRESKKGKEPLTTIINDTIISEQNGPCLECFSFSLNSRDTTLLIDHESYVLSYTSVMDTTVTLTQIDVHSNDGKNYKNIYKGYNAFYTVSLKDKDGQVVFTKKFSKKTFQEEGDYEKSIVVESGAYLPSFIGYLPHFDSFLFTLVFAVPDSDVGIEYFFMINRKGELTKNFVNNWYGGGGCDGEIELPASKDFILTCVNIINPNVTINLDKENVAIIGTKLINDSTILVIKPFDDSTKIPNAVLMDNFGKLFRRFTYNGYHEILGYVVPMRYDSLSESYYLLDETLKNLRIINRHHPLDSESFDLELMESYNGNAREHEIRVSLNTETSENNFYIDTITQQVRYEGSIGK
jgi:hypothetical protein